MQTTPERPVTQPTQDNENPSDPRRDVQEIQGLTPFSANDLKGTRFARGNMLGGASPLESAVPAPWAEGSSNAK